MSPRVLPYGAWPSPISAQDLVAGGDRVDEPYADGAARLWLESREDSGGRMILVRREPDGRTRDLTYEDFSVRSRVHEYGGGAWTVGDGVVVVVDHGTQRLWRIDGEARPLTAESGTPDSGPRVRWAAPLVDLPRHRVVAVRETHGLREHGVDLEPVNELVAVDLDGDAADEPRVLVPGRRRTLPRPDSDDAGDPALPDHVSDPVLSPSGTRLAWTSWSHPHMSWDAGEVWVCELDDAGGAASPRRVAGGPDEPAGTPVWVDDDRLALLVERDGWRAPFVADLAAAGDGAPSLRALDPEAGARGSEHGSPGWVLRGRGLALGGDGRLWSVRHDRGRTGLCRLDPDRPGAVEDVPLEVADASCLSACDDGVLARLALPGVGAVVATVRGDGAVEVLRVGPRAAPEGLAAPAPEQVTWTGHGGETAYGWLHRPHHPDVEGPSDERPPLVVVAHGGPTSATLPLATLDTAYLTSRGIAVLDVDYAGSTGYGRAYRERLEGLWGVADITDVVTGAGHLADAGVVDPARLGVRGGSAGGFVVLAALAFHDVFSAGVSLFGVSDLALLAEETHKFESRYLDGLVGPWPAAREVYEERSPLHHLEGVQAALLLLQGLEDRVVPPNQARLVHEALREQGADVDLVEYAGEGHGFRDPGTLLDARRRETAFLGRVWGFEPSDPV